MSNAITRDTLYILAEYLTTGLVLILGLKYLRDIMSFVFTELYKYFVQGR